MVDRKARKILLDTFWNSEWRHPPSTSLEDFEYAKSKGMMFDSAEVTHDVLVDRLISLRKLISVRSVANAFLSSLTTRRLDLRSALGSLAVASHFPDHKISSSPRTSLPSGGEYCEVCGYINFQNPKMEDLNVLNFERHKWGGVRHHQPLYAWFDLSQFQVAEQPDPTDADRDIMRNILYIAGRAPSDSRPSGLAKNLSGVFNSNEYERRGLLEILGYCGILQPLDHGGYFGEFTLACDRHHTGGNNDWSYPVNWWRGWDGVNTTAVAAYFPEL